MIIRHNAVFLTTSENLPHDKPVEDPPYKLFQQLDNHHSNQSRPGALCLCGFQSQVSCCKEARFYITEVQPIPGGNPQGFLSPVKTQETEHQLQEENFFMPQIALKVT